MIKFPLRHKIVAFLSCILLLTAQGCPPTPTGPTIDPTTDTSPPGFVEVIVELNASPNPNKRINITSGNVTENKIASNVTIRITATAEDRESSIVSIVPSSTFDFACGASGSLRGVLQTITLPFRGSTGPATPAILWQLDTATSPPLATGCAQNDPIHGPVRMSGFVFVTATNGKGLTTESSRFIFDYVDVGRDPGS